MPQLRKTRGQASSSSVEVKLRKIEPEVPLNPDLKEQLMEDLTSMGCIGLGTLPWGFKEPALVRELIGKVSNEWDNTIRGKPHLWTDEVWRSVYSFRAEGLGMANRKDDFVRGKFEGAVNPKDGYALEDCINDRERRVLQFLVPILHPEKPTRITITLANTIFGALRGDRKVDWGRIIADLVTQLVTRVGKSRATPVCPYLFHLYKNHGLLTDKEDDVWQHQEVVLIYGASEDEKAEDSGSDPEVETDSDDEEPAMPPIKRQKHTPPNQRGTPPHRETTGPEEVPEPERRISDEGDASDPFSPWYQSFVTSGWTGRPRGKR